MNNGDVVVILEECWQAVAAGPVEPTSEAKEEFQRCRASLCAELSMLLEDAAAMKWPFVPEKWQYKQSITSEDKTNLKELVNQHLHQLLLFLRASIFAGEPLWAVSVVFLVDRFLYWVDTSRSLLKIVKALHKHYPAMPVAPQMVIRQARLSLNFGYLQKAEYILSSLINNSGETGCWVYHADSDRALVQAVSVQVRGQVLQKLGLWIEAAELIWASLIGFYALPDPDKKGIGTSLGLLGKILVSMNNEDFQAFSTSSSIDLCFLKDRGHRLLAAAEAAKMAVVYSQYDSLYVLTNVVTQGTCLLAYSFSIDCPTTERGAFLTKAKEAFQIGLLTKKEGEVVTSKQELHTFIKAAYSLTVTHKWLGSAVELLNKASQECQNAIEKLYAYGAVDGQERDAVGAEIMHLVGQVKVLLGVEPFPRSDERSFIPDDYRAAEEIPIRFSLDYFSKVMARFQQHHTSVCEAYNTSCKGTLCRNRGQGSPGACITAMRTTTENLETVDSTEGYRCLGRKQERQKAEISVDLQCLTEASDEEEMNRVPRHAECKFKGITIVKTSSNGKDAVKLAKQRVEAWVDQQCVTEISDDDDQNICSENASPASLIGYEGKISFSAQETRGVVGGMGVDLNCDTEGSDEEMTGQTNSAGSVFHRMRKVRNSSHSLGDSLGSDSSWLKLSLSDRELPLGNGKETHNAADQTAEEWVDLQCPAKFSEDEELNGVGQRCKGKNRIRTSSSSLGDSLGSNSSWQKLSLCDVALQINDSNHAGSLAKQRVVVEVDPQSTTQASDEADQSDLRNSAVCRPIPVHRTYIGLHNQPLDQTFLATNTSPGNKNTRPWCVSGEDLSFQLVDSEVAVIRTDTPAGPSAADVSLTCDNQLPEPHDVDPLADTEEYGLEYFEMPPESIHTPLGHYPVNSSSNYKESHAPGTEIRKMGDPVQSRSVGVMENKKELVDLGKLHLDRDSCLSQSNQSHDQCIANCMLGCAGTEHLPKLTVQDYRALLSGVCHKCLLNRLSIKKTFRLRKHRRAYSALLLKYSKVSDRWMSQETKVYIGEPLGKKGNQRTAFWVHFLHQEETLSSYVGKTYQLEKTIHYHLNDVERQMVAQYYVTEFNKRLYKKNIPAQIFYIPSEVLLILENDTIMDCVTVEPFMQGDFVKLTNNTTYKNQYASATDYGIAFGHFTYQLSGTTEVVVDLQGWVTDNGKGLTYLTDPQLHSTRKSGSRTCHSEKGIRQFLEVQHGPLCNDICKSLSLEKLQQPHF